MTQRGYNDISVNNKHHDSAQVDPDAFKHELTQIYLELKDSFSTEYVAHQVPKSEFDEDILNPNTKVQSLHIDVQLPKSIDIVSCDVRDCNIDNEENTVCVEPQTIYNPAIQRFEVELPQEYDFKQEKIRVPNTGWCEPKTENIKTSELSMIIPSNTKTKQEFDFEENVDDTVNIEIKPVKTNWKQNDVHIDDDLFAFNYVNPNVTSISKDSFSFKPVKVDYKTSIAKIVMVDEKISFEIDKYFDGCQVSKNESVLNAIEVMNNEATDAQNCNPSNEGNTVCIKHQEICHPTIQKLEVEIPQEYDFKQEKVRIPNTDWCKPKTEDIEVSQFSLVVPSNTTLKQEFDFKDNVDNKYNFEIKLAKTNWKQNETHVCTDLFGFEYENPYGSLFSLEPIKEAYKTITAQFEEVAGDVSLRLEKDFDGCQNSQNQSVQNLIELVNNSEVALGEMADGMSHFLETLNYDLLKR